MGHRRGSRQKSVQHSRTKIFCGPLVLSERSQEFRKTKFPKVVFQSAAFRTNQSGVECCNFSISQSFISSLSLTLPCPRFRAGAADQVLEKGRGEGRSPNVRQSAGNQFKFQPFQLSGPPFSLLPCPRRGKQSEREGKLEEKQTEEQERATENFES